MPPAAAHMTHTASTASPSAVELSRRLSPVVGHSPRTVSPAPFAPLPPPTPPPPPLVSPPPTAAQAGGTPQSARLAAQQAAAQQYAAPQQQFSECGDVGDSISRGSGWAPSCQASTPLGAMSVAEGRTSDYVVDFGEHNELALRSVEPPTPPSPAAAAPPPPTVLLPSFAPPTADAAADAAAVPEAVEPEVVEPGARGLMPCGKWAARLCGAGGRVSGVALGSDGGSLWVATSTPAALPGRCHPGSAAAAAEGGVAGGDKYAVRKWRLADDTQGASWSRQWEVPCEVGAMQAHGGRAYAACHDGALYRFGEAEVNAPPGTLAHLQAPPGTPARFDSGHTAPVLALEVEGDTRDGTNGATARPRAALLLTASADATLRGFDLPLRASQVALEPRCVMARHAAAVRALCTVCLPPRFGRPLEARIALSGGDDASVRVWSLRDGVGCGACLGELLALGAAVQALRPLSEGRAVTALASGALLLLQATPLQQAGGGVSWHVAEELPASPPPATSLCSLDADHCGPTHCFAAASTARLHVWSAEEPPPTEGGLRLLTAELAACVESHALDRPPLALLSGNPLDDEP